MYQQPYIYQAAAAAAAAAAWGQQPPQQQVQPQFFTAQAPAPTPVHQFIHPNVQPAASQLQFNQPPKTVPNQLGQLNPTQQVQVSAWGQQGLVGQVHTSQPPQTSNWSQPNQQLPQQVQQWVSQPSQQQAPQQQQQQQQLQVTAPPSQKPQPPLPQQQYQQPSQPPPPKQPPLPKQPPPPQQNQQQTSGHYQPPLPTQQVNNQQQPPLPSKQPLQSTFPDQKPQTTPLKEQQPYYGQQNTPTKQQNHSIPNTDETKQWVREPQVPPKQIPPPPNEPPADSLKRGATQQNHENSQPAQPAPSVVSNTTNEKPPEKKDEEEESLSSLNKQLETLETQIKTYQEEYQKWHQDFVKWQKQHQNHPDQKQYIDYQKQYQKMIEEQQNQLKNQYHELQKKIAKRKAEHKATAAAKVAAAKSSTTVVAKPATPDFTDKDINNLKTLAAHAQKLQVLQDLGEIKKNEGKVQAPAPASNATNYKPPISAPGPVNPVVSTSRQLNQQNLPASQSNSNQRETLTPEGSYQKDVPATSQENSNVTVPPPQDRVAPMRQDQYQRERHALPPQNQYQKDSSGHPQLDQYPREPPSSLRGHYERELPSPQLNQFDRDQRPQFDREQRPHHPSQHPGESNSPQHDQFQRDGYPQPLSRENQQRRELPPVQQNRYQRDALPLHQQQNLYGSERPSLQQNQHGEQRPPPQNQYEREPPPTQQNQYKKEHPVVDKNEYGRELSLSQREPPFQRETPPPLRNQHHRDQSPHQQHQYGREPPSEQNRYLTERSPPKQAHERGFQHLQNPHHRNHPPLQQSQYGRDRPPSPENRYQRDLTPGHQNQYGREPRNPDNIRYQRDQSSPRQNQYERERAPPLQNEYQREQAPHQNHFEREPLYDQNRYQRDQPPPQENQYGRGTTPSPQNQYLREPPPPQQNQYRREPPQQHQLRREGPHRYQLERGFAPTDESEYGRDLRPPNQFSREPPAQNRNQPGQPLPPHHNRHLDHEFHPEPTHPVSAEPRVNRDTPAVIPRSNRNEIRPVNPQDTEPRPHWLEDEQQKDSLPPGVIPGPSKEETRMPPGIVRTKEIENDEQLPQAIKKLANPHPLGFYRRAGNEYAGTKCKFFPKCRYGKECKFDHEMCSRSSKCQDDECPFEHPLDRDMEAVQKNSGKRETKTLERGENTNKVKNATFSMGSVLNNMSANSTETPKKEYPKPTISLSASSNETEGKVDANARKRPLPDGIKDFREDPSAKTSKSGESADSGEQEKVRSAAIQARIDEIFKKRQIEPIANPYSKHKQIERKPDSELKENVLEKDKQEVSEVPETKLEGREIRPGIIEREPVKVDEIAPLAKKAERIEDEYERRKREILGPSRSNGDSHLPPGIVPLDEPTIKPRPEGERRPPEINRGREAYERLPERRPIYPEDRFPDDPFRDRFRPPPVDGRLRDYPPELYSRYGREVDPYERVPRLPPGDPLYDDYRRDPYEIRREAPVSIDYGHGRVRDPYLDRRLDDPYLERREPAYPDRYSRDPLREREYANERRLADPYGRPRDPPYEDTLYQRERARALDYPPNQERDLLDRKERPRDVPVNRYERPLDPVRGPIRDPLRDPVRDSVRDPIRDTVRDPYERPLEGHERLRDLSDRKREVAPRERYLEPSRERSRSRERNRDRSDRGRGHQLSESSSRRRDAEYRDSRDDDRGRSRYRDRDEGRDHRVEKRSHDRPRESRLPEVELKPEVFSANDIFDMPGRKSRPKNIVIILRGIPGAGKSFIAKLIKDKESQNGAQPPRILALDDYFMQDVENKETRKTEQQYVYEKEMEEPYRTSLLKAFNKTLSDGFFPMVIVDAINNKTKQFDQFWSDAKHKGFEVYIADVKEELNICMERSIHKRSLEEVQEMLRNWEEPPVYYKRLDTRALLQDAAIDDVEMEEAPVSLPEQEENKEEEEEEELPSTFHIPQSKWETAKEETLAKLDGIINRKAKGKPASPMLPDSDDEDDPYGEKEADMRLGKKRVRWADIEEKKQIEHHRKIGFTIGMDWNIYTNPDATIPR